ncbi:Uncharacterised protein [Chryseobacterium nakagawai]|uniref:Uncharacterized protein n=1 Tax=Chryseobacterium nakagawai TaxID=1241982 RepID=A0AAD1DS58_CHRNA|nr:hypothetical protein [Chryseobacterium nakagawai]AZA93182.1 hypothetical protein EG343_22530 [Chryseobacterium nakagawai]VEH19834.1 Uncharacterised protein [Chryseobacterium nakagawai]
MNITKTNTEIPFPSVESEINRWVTFILQTTYWGMLIFFFCLFIIGPAYGIYNKGTKMMLSVALISWGSSILILIPVIRQYVIRRENIANKIVIDHTGLLFYNAKNKIIQQILYTELCSSKQNFDIYTVTPIGSTIIPLLEVTVQQEKNNVETRRIDMNLPLRVLKNKVTLYTHFLYGISIFRQDLKIDPITLKSFSIDPNTWHINSKKGVSLGGWLFILAVIVITCILVGIPFLLYKFKN